MRSLVKQYLDSDLSRRSMMRQLALWGVSLASAEALLDSLGVARAQEGPPSENDQTTVDGEGKEVTGNGADLLMETLIAAGVKYVFHGSGGGSNRFFDAIVVRPELKNFLGTNEGQSVAMADGYHLATGELGLAIIPKPGLFNAASNIHNALAHRSSLFVLTARENNKWSERRGNIEVIDGEKSMDPMMKWSYRMHQLDRVPEFASRAIKVANTPLGGPVFLQMDEDLYESETTAVIPPQDHFRVNANVRPDPELAELLGVPVTQNLSVHVDFPNQHPLFLGAYNRFLGYTREADLFMLIGAQMPDIGHYIVTGPPPVNAKTVHISMEPELLANFYPTELSIMANAKAAVSDLIEAVKSLATKERIASIKAAREEKMLARIQDARERSILSGRTGWDEATVTFARLPRELDNALLERRRCTDRSQAKSSAGRRRARSASSWPNRTSRWSPSQATGR